MRISVRLAFGLMVVLSGVAGVRCAIAATPIPSASASSSATVAPSAAAAPGAASSAASASASIIAGVITAIADDQSSLRIVDSKGKAYTAAIVAGGGLTKAQLGAYQRGDAVAIQTIGGANGAATLSDIQPRSITVSRGMRILALGCAGVLLTLIALILSGSFGVKLLIGEDNRYSNSKFQLLLWFSALIASYIALFALRILYAGTDFIGGISIPQDLAVLTGISAFTLGAAKGITTNAVAEVRKKDVAAALAAHVAGLAAPAATPNLKTAGAPSFVRDLTHNDRGEADVGDFQQVVVTLVAVGAYLIAIFHYLGTITMMHSITLPDVDSTVLAVFGLGHGAYLTKKYASLPGEG